MEKRLIIFCCMLGLFGIALVANSYLAFSALDSINQSREVLTEQHARAIAVANNLRYLQAAENEHALRFVISPEAASFETIKEIRSSFKEAAKTLLVIIDPTIEKERITRIMAAKDDVAMAADPILEARLRGASINETHRKLDKKVNELVTLIDSELDDLRKDELIDFSIARAKFERSLHTLGQNLLISTAFICLAFATLIWLFWKLELRRRELMNQTEATAKARKEILETVAHDLKNPLGSIQLSLQMVLEDQDQPVSSVVDLLEVANRSSETMRRLVFDLLDHAKIESGSLSITTKTADLCDLSDNLIKRHHVLAGEKAITLQFEKPNTPVYAQCDEARIDQLMSNLIGNAIKFTPAHGMVTVRLEKRLREILISVQDNGQGMSHEDVKHVFDRYWQVGATASKGTGLGLAISKAIAEAHSGKLWVESTEHKGSTFFVSLPSTAPDQFA